MVKIKVSETRNVIAQLFGKLGMNAHEAQIMAKVLVETDQRGVMTHGIVAAPRYLRMIRDGEMKANVEYDQ